MSIYNQNPVIFAQELAEEIYGQAYESDGFCNSLETEEGHDISEEFVNKTMENEIHKAIMINSMVGLILVGINFEPEQYKVNGEFICQEEDENLMGEIEVYIEKLAGKLLTLNETVMIELGDIISCHGIDDFNELVELQLVKDNKLNNGIITNISYSLTGGNNIAEGLVGISVNALVENY